tara:strand:- start:20414 stop:20578 length:165 start_codon:yes stop_codon:yes gene_type:complete
VSYAVRPSTLALSKSIEYHRCLATLCFVLIGDASVAGLRGLVRPDFDLWQERDR